MNHRNGLPQLSERHLAMLAEMGVTTWWTEERPGQPDQVAPLAAHAPPLSNREKPVVAPMRPARVAEQAPAAPRPVVVWAQADHAALSRAVQACTACDLAQYRHQAVVGMGDMHPDWLVVGEAPGEEEDRQGLPFVGRAGQLLDKMLNAMGLNRERGVYIANVIKCRPPQNRNPEPAEVAQCTPYLLRQIELLQPKIVLAMGRFAAQTVLGQGGCMPADALLQMPLGKLRGRVYQAQLGKMSLPVVVTYHPAYLLRSPAEKAKAWADLCLAMDAHQNL